MEWWLTADTTQCATYEGMLRLGRWAHDSGFAGFARSDHYLSPFGASATTDALTTLAGVAREVPGLGLAVLMTPATFRHPAVVAKTATSLWEMSGGRFRLGLGAGWLRADHERFGVKLPEAGERLDRLEDAAGYLRALARGEAYRGRWYAYAGGALDPPLATPLVLGGGGAVRTPEVAGRLGDEYNVPARPLPELTARVERMRTAAGAAGRSAPPTVSVMGPLVAAARDADLVGVLQGQADALGVDRERYRRALARSGALYGTVAQVREHLDALRRLGMERYYVSAPAALDAGQLEALGTAIEELGA